MILAGYESGKTDFDERLSVAPGADGEFERIAYEAFSAISTPGECAVITVAGHSDRVDTPGIDREQRREQELQASKDRAQSALAFIDASLRGLAAQPLPADLNDLQQIHFSTRWAGASLLVEKDAILSEAQRQSNRRVQLRVIRFAP